MKERKVKQWLLLFCMALSPIISLMAQQVTSTKGVVKDTYGEAIIGANILEKGTSNGTITDLDGNFTLTVSPGATLVITYIGYVSQELPASAQMDIVLKEDSESLDEVVVVGYGVQRKSNLTGSISSVKSSDIDNRTVSDVNQALQGKTSGVQLLSTSASPGAESSIRIRGFSSNTTSDPLYVVDGVRVSGISNIDPTDIESIEVLKDAASAAIYGAEAGNGVVLVTTKKGKKGDGKITYNFQYAIQSLAKKPKVMNASQYLVYAVQSGGIDQALADEWDGTDTNWCDVTFESSPMQKHSISFQNGGEKGTFYASLNYVKNNGIVVGDKDSYRRIVGSINVDYDIKKWLTLSTSNVLTYYKRSTVTENSPYGSVLRAAIALDPLTPNIYEADNLSEHMQTLVNAGYNLVTNEDGDYYSISTYNPNDQQINPNIMINVVDNNGWGHFIQGNFSANIKPFKGFTFTSRLGYRLVSRNSREYHKAYYANSNAFLDEPTIESTIKSEKYFQWENFANYLFSLGEHNFTAMVGTSFSSDVENYVTTGGSGLQADEANYAYPDYLSASATELVTEGDETRTKKLSFFGRLSYDYKSKYMLQFTFRADAADLSILPKAQRWGYFPAVSAGWTVSNESWFPQTKWVSSLKVRGSWGQNGSIAGLSNFSYSNAVTSDGGYSFTPGEASYTNASQPSSTGNQALKWETSEQTDLGIDARFFDSRLSISVDYFIKKTKDLIVSDTSPTLTVGNTVSPVNAGDVENKGWEFDLSWKDHIGSLEYSISGNLATLKNKVTYLDPSIDRIAGAYYDYHTISAFEKGLPVWYFRGYKVDHIDSETGNPLFVEADGTLTEDPTSEAQTMIGSAIPDFTYGITLNLSWKNFDFVAFGQGSQGNQIYSALTRTVSPAANRLSCYYTDAWTSDHTDAKYARMSYQESNYWHSNIAIFDGSYFKIKQIQLGYTLPKQLTKKVGIDALRVYVSLDDFFLFTSYPGMDPESSSGSTDSLGVDLGTYPNSKKMLFGLNLSF